MMNQIHGSNDGNKKFVENFNLKYLVEWAPI